MTETVSDLREGWRSRLACAGRASFRAFSRYPEALALMIIYLSDNKPDATLSDAITMYHDWTAETRRLMAEVEP